MYFYNDYSPEEQAKDDKAIATQERATSHYINQIDKSIDELAELKPFGDVQEIAKLQEKLNKLVHYLEKPF